MTPPVCVPPSNTSITLEHEDKSLDHTNARVAYLVYSPSKNAFLSDRSDLPKHVLTWSEKSLLNTYAWYFWDSEQREKAKKFINRISEHECVIVPLFYNERLTFKTRTITYNVDWENIDD